MNKHSSTHTIKYNYWEIPQGSISWLSGGFELPDHRLNIALIPTLLTHHL